ncbi:glycosyltransferase [Ekhidna sp.]|uniref:glycosyltransferase n=1 Tax=Ekhidna sp. TaxID=2608089 RepID=UPI003CCBB33D
MNYLLAIIFIYLSFSTLYCLYFSVRSLGPLKTTSNKADHYHRIAVFIPAYKEDGVILDTAKRSLEQEYPKDRYDVIVIADSLQDATIKELRSLPIRVMNFFFPKSTKAKAINAAYRQLREDYDITVILDADNIMGKNFLKKVNHEYCKGIRVMQGQRIAKNYDTPMAILDGISEGINNNIFRKGHVASGLSSALIGSAMAFDFKLYRNYMKEIDAVGGFDKELELALLKNGHKIHYIEDAFVLDEKVSNDQVFEKQRTRWIAAQIRYGMKSFGNAFMKLLSTGNVDYFDKALQFVMPPRLILLGFLAILSVVSLFIDFSWAIAFGTALFAYVLSLILATPSWYKIKDLFKVAAHVPKSFVLMLKSVAGYKMAKTNFLHTPHQLKEQKL